jgi:dTDP-4-dehydrorhamnose reductase
MRVLVTGFNGQLGYDVVKELKKRNIDCIGVDIDDFDITNTNSVDEFIKNYQPDSVIHCAAYTAVDKAEENPNICSSINIDGTRNIAQSCASIDSKLIYISTDYVFSGKGDKFHEVNDPVQPLNIYGKTKLGGELAVQALLSKYFIVRTSWVFGINGKNFIETMIALAETRNEIKVVADQMGSPTYTTDLACLLCDMIITEKYGIYHATNEGVCSWAELAEETFRIAGYEIVVNHITTEEYPTKAIRPQNSRLSKKSLDEAGFTRLPEWKDAVKRYIEELSQ